MSAEEGLVIVCTDCKRQGHVARDCPDAHRRAMGPWPGGITEVEGAPQTIERKLEDMRGELKQLAADLLRHDDIEAMCVATDAILAVGRLIGRLHEDHIASERWGIWP